MRYTSVFGKKQSDLIRPTGTFPSQRKACVTAQFVPC